MNRTTNYNLCQWEADDKVQRTDFNEDNAKIDEALSAKAETSALAALAAQVAELSQERVVIGSYIGDGTNDRVIRLPFKPKIVVVSGIASTSATYTSIMFTVTFGPYSHQFHGGDGNSNRGNIIIKDNGFLISGGAHNCLDMEEHYFAIR